MMGGFDSRFARMMMKSLFLMALMVGLVKGEVLICTKSECMTEFGRKVKCYGVNAGEKTLFIQSFRGSDGRYYGYRQIALSNLFLTDDDTAASGSNNIVLGTTAPAVTITDTSREVEGVPKVMKAFDKQQRAQKQAFSFPGFRGPICVDNEPQIFGDNGVVAFAKPFGLCCRACGF